MQASIAKLPPRLQGPVQEYVGLLQALAGGSLLSVTLFGEAASNQDGDRAGLVQSVVVLDKVELDFVRELGAQGPSVGRIGFQAPLLMTPGYIAASRDVFPIELLDIQNRHMLVLGEDYFAPLVFDKAHVRLQLEHELKRELLQIRQGILASGGRDKVLTDIYWGASEQLLALLRAVLWLHNKAMPAAAVALVRAAEEDTHVPLPGLQPALSGARVVDFEVLRSLYQNVLALADYIDEMPV